MKLEKTARLPAGRLFCLMVVAAGLAAAGCAAKPSPSTTLISNAIVVDGSGAPPIKVAVRIEGQRITEVGALKARRGENRIDAGGLVLAPGFIDTHSHADEHVLEQPEALVAVSQGVSTVIVGVDGFSKFPLAEFYADLETNPPVVNTASYAGHNTLRAKVMGDDFRRHATGDEIEAMCELLEREIRGGAIGLSTGLEYDPGIYSETEEVIALAKKTAALGGRYTSHIRSEDRYFEDAIEEAITIAREAQVPVQISHLKLAIRRQWGCAQALITRLDEARSSGVDITADIYPYEYWQATLTVLFPERNFEDRAAAEFALSELSMPDGLLMSRFDPEPSYVGKTIAQISALRGTDDTTTLMALIAEAEPLRAETGEYAETVIGTGMMTGDIEELLSWPHANVGTDSYLVDRHPRAAGTYARVLGRYVREKKILSLEEAIHKMSGLPARHLGLEDRGLIAPGMFADLVLFDPETILDHATLKDPTALSTGVTGVWVNGVRVFDGGASTGARPGRVIRSAIKPSILNGFSCPAGR